MTGSTHLEANHTPSPAQDAPLQSSPMKPSPAQLDQTSTFLTGAHYKMKESTVVWGSIYGLYSRTSKRVNPP